MHQSPTREVPPLHSMYQLGDAAPQGEPERAVTPAAAFYDQERISDALRALAYKWVPEVFPQGRIKDGALRVGGIDGHPPRTQGSCAIELAGDHAGDWFDYSLNGGGGPLSTIGEHYGIAGRELIEKCVEIIEHHGGAGYLTRQGADRPRPPSSADRDASKLAREEKNKREAGFIISQSVHYSGTLAETYLRARGITQMPHTNELWFQPNLGNRSTNLGHPTLIAIFRNADGSLTGGIHRTYLLDDASWHIGKEHGKKMLGPPGLVMLGMPDTDGNLGGKQRGRVTRLWG